MRQLKPVLLALALGLSVGVSANATSVNFTFDTQLVGTTTITGLSAGATSAQIQAYMNAVLTAAGCTGCSVLVATGAPGSNTSGSTSMGAVADQTYTGEGHVVGPVVGGVVHPATLGTTNGATSNSSNTPTFGTYDTFIANTNDSSSQVSTQITLQFTGLTGLTVTSFDYEIFPNAPSNGQPDLIFEAGTHTNGVDTAVASFGTAGTQLGVTPSIVGSDGTNTKSCTGQTPCVVGTETNAQYIGTWTGSLTNVSELDFVDWPATIGVDNLQISFTNHNTPTVPEPASIALLGAVVVLVGKKLRKAERPL